MFGCYVFAADKLRGIKRGKDEYTSNEETTEK